MPELRAVVVGIDGDLIQTIREDGFIDIIGVVDNPRSDQRSSVPLVASDEGWVSWRAANTDVYAVLAIDIPSRRRAALANFDGNGLIGYVSSRANVAATAAIGLGTILQRGVDVAEFSSVGEYVKIGIGATIHHECEIDDFVTIAPGARLLGKVSVGSGAYVGAGATVLPRLMLGVGAVIGAGAVVTKDVGAGVTMVGVPARPIASGRGVIEHVD